MKKTDTEESLTSPKTAWARTRERLHFQFRRPFRFRELQKQVREHRCIFIHIPKCAGTSICETLFGTTVGGHRTLIGYETIVPPRIFAESFKFTFVRNPWDRLSSAFHFLKNRDLKSNQKWAREHLADFNTFDAFVRGWVTRKNIWSYSHFRPQYYFTRLKSKKPAVDFIGFYENLGPDFAAISRELKRSDSLLEENRNAHHSRDFRELYTEETRRIVADVYADDIEIFGYTFDNSSLPDQIARRDRDFLARQ